MFQDKLLECRKKAGLSQEELANHLGVSRQSVSKWENGTSFPEMDKCVECCKLFHISMDELFMDEPNKTIDENIYNQMVKANKKANKDQWFLLAVSLVIIGSVAIMSFFQTLSSYSKIQQYEKMYQNLDAKYEQLSQQLNNIQNYLVNDEESLALELTDVKYLNSKEVAVHLETRLNHETMDNQVQLILEYENHKEAIDLFKKELTYENDVILPIETILNSTLVVKNGDTITNYPVYLIGAANGLERKEVLKSHWNLWTVKIERDHLVFGIDKIEELYSNGTTLVNNVDTIQRIEIVDETGQIVKSLSLPEEYYTFEVDMDIRKVQGLWKVYFIYEKDGLTVREYKGEFFQHTELTDWNWKFHFNQATDFPEVDEIQIID